MTEQSDGQGVVNGEDLRASLESLKVRGTFAEGIWGVAALGVYVPTRREWNAGRPQAIGADIRHALAGDGPTIRVTALNDAVMHRRQEATGRLTGFAYTKLLREDGPIQRAEVTGVTDVALRNGRTLPLLRLMELGNPADEEFVVSLPDMANYIQTNQVELELT